MKKFLLLIIVFSLLSLTILKGLCQTNYYCVDRGDNFKVLYLDEIVSKFELERIIENVIEDKTQFHVREREYTFDIYVEREFWMTVRYSIHNGLKIIREEILWKD